MPVVVLEGLQEVEHPYIRASHPVLTPDIALYLPASQLVQTVAPAIYIHTLSHTTLGKFLHLYI